MLRCQKQGDVVIFRAFFVFTRPITHAQFVNCRTLPHMRFKKPEAAKVASGVLLSQSPWHFDPTDRKCARALGTRLNTTSNDLLRVQADVENYFRCFFIIFSF